MPRFAANLSMMFTEHEFLDRFDAAAEAGFGAVEYLFPYEHPPEAIAQRLERNDLVQALFNMPPGSFAAGTVNPFLQDGKLKALAVVQDQRSAIVPLWMRAFLFSVSGTLTIEKALL